MSIEKDGNNENNDEKSAKRAFSEAECGMEEAFDRGDIAGPAPDLPSSNDNPEATPQKARTDFTSRPS